jgi:hypothetical protein
MLRFGSRAFSAAAVRPVKLSTGVVGLDVVPNAREVLTSLYTRTLAEVQVMPETVFYRQSVEKFTRYRLDVVAKTTDVREALGRRGGGCGRQAAGSSGSPCISLPPCDLSLLTLSLHPCPPSTHTLSLSLPTPRLMPLRARLAAGRWRS